jgi:dienelactone hydrolase
MAAAPEPAADVTALLQLDPKLPVAAKELGSSMLRHAVVKEVRFAGQRAEEQVAGALVEPEQPGTYAGVLYVHWLGDPKSTNRNEFLDEAVNLASHGVVSLVIDAPWSQRGWFKNLKRDEDVQTCSHAVVLLRRALAVLAAQPNVDKKRIALVGHDYGAMFGLMAGALEGTPSTYVLMAPTPHLSDWFFLGEKPKDKNAYVASISRLDPIRFVPKLGAAKVFYQFASRDEFVPREHADELVNATPGKPQVRRYDTDHGLGNKDGVHDRILFLSKQLNLPR